MIFDRGLLLILGINPDDFQNMDDQQRKKAAKKSYHKKAQEFHPDKWHEKESSLTYDEQTARFKEIVHAYKMLTDAEYRYQQNNPKTQTSLHAVISVDLTFNQAFFGMSTTITFRSTHLDENGEAMTIDEEEDVHFDIDVIRVVVPANSAHGDRIVIKNKGLKQGDRKGDLMFVLNVRPHPKFEYDPQTKTFFCSENLPLETLIGGGELEVETMFGLSTVRIPAGSVPGQKIKQKGIKEHKDYNIELTVHPKYPDKKDLKGSSFWDKLDINWEKEDELDEEIRKAEEDYEKTFNRLGGFTFTSTGSSSGFGF